MLVSNIMQTFKMRSSIVTCSLCILACGSLAQAQTQKPKEAESNKAVATSPVIENSAQKKTQKTTQTDKPGGAAAGLKKDKNGWLPMLPKKELGPWEVTDYGGQGEVDWDGKRLVMKTGDPMTGINYTKKDFPTSNYEIRLKAQRVKGSDFFCCLTFPVGDEFCSFVAGGWGGGTTGLSCINGSDASENGSTGYQTFETGKWYSFRLVVDDKQVRVWIDGEACVEQEREYAKFSTRIEVFSAEPLGLCAFMTEAAVSDFKWRTLEDAKKARQKLASQKKEAAKKKAAESKAGKEAPL